MANAVDPSGGGGGTSSNYASGLPITATVTSLLLENPVDASGTSANLQRYDFPVGIENYQLQLPSRSSVVQSLGSVYMFHLGTGLRNIVITGSTGYRPVQAAALYGDIATARSNAVIPSSLLAGWQSFQKLLTMIQDYQSAFENKQVAKLYLVVNAPQDPSVYLVNPAKLLVTRNKQQPLLVMFELSVTVLSLLQEGSTKDNINNGSTSAAGKLTIDANSVQKLMSSAVTTSNNIVPVRPVTYVILAGQPNTISGITKLFQGSPGLWTTEAAIRAANKSSLSNVYTDTTTLATGIVLSIPMVEHSA